MAKTEGTSQTYGQLIVLSITEDTLLGNNKENLVAPQDIAITLVPSTEIKSADEDRKKVIEAAFANPVGVAAVSTKKDLDFDELNDNYFLTSLVNSEVVELTTATVVGSRLKTKQEITDALKEASKTDLLIALKSKDSEMLEFNNLKIPDFDGQYIYNFYSSSDSYQEDDLVGRENGNDLLSSLKATAVPQYIELSWKSLKKAEIIKGQKVNQTTSADAIEQLAKNNNGQTIVDIDNLEKAFNSVNNANQFTNGANAVLSANNRNSLSSLPIINPNAVTGFGTGIARTNIRGRGRNNTR
jgi:hypothetical protein